MSQKYPELRIRYNSDNIPNQLENIAKNSGFDSRNEFVKQKLREIVDSTPAHLKVKNPL